MQPDIPARPMLSLIVPMYNEAQSIDLFMQRVLPVLHSLTENWEIICVDDGSRDHTLACLKALSAQDARIRYVSFSRNFGKEAALTAGLDKARGQAVIPIDADLQDPPELIPEMVALWRQGYKVVYATRRSRHQDSWFKRSSAGAYYRLLSKIAPFRVPENTGDYRLMDACVVEVIRQLPERTRFMKGLFAWAGFTSTPVYFDRPKRVAGDAKFSLRMLWRHAKDGIFSFTTAPLRISTYLGALISLFSFSYAAYLILRTLVHGVELPGYASIMTVVLCMGGIQLLSLGIIGEYIGRTYLEAKKRPIYLIEESSEL